MANLEKRILIIDDDDETCQILKKRLSREGYTCQAVHSVQQGLHALRQLQPDLVILDLMMEKVSGPAFLASVKTWIKPGQKLPQTIVLSGISDPEVVDFMLQMGAKKFMSKPYNPDFLLKTLAECFHERSATHPKNSHCG